ncbi:MAG: NTP transferase domain-containing protein [Aigarchaeota archaeon]|nr:NTP transferase domain-containing protein [Aigarchaeota archaeon]MDW8092136.1 NTP transferase domain-containing protein [Nitrososphaerota archaeon]
MHGIAIIWTDFKPVKGIERGLLQINNRPTIEYVLEALPDEIGEVFLSVKGEAEARLYNEIAERYFARLHVGRGLPMTEEVARLVGDEEIDSFIILPCDAPLLNKGFTSFLLEGTKKFSAIIPRSSDENCYYLFSSYRSREFVRACNSADRKQFDSVVNQMNNVLYVKLSALRVFDEKLNIFMRVNDFSDTKRIESIMRQSKS